MSSFENRMNLIILKRELVQVLAHSGVLEPVIQTHLPLMLEIVIALTPIKLSTNNLRRLLPNPNQAYAASLAAKAWFGRRTKNH